MNAKILKLDIGGRPIAWITREAGALHYCRDQVAWEAGIEFLRLRGGIARRTGRRSVLYVSTIIATHGVNRQADLLHDVPALTNDGLFFRDEYICLYCGEEFWSTELTRDHVVPVSRGGTDSWDNVVTACRACNQKKADRSLAECDAIGLRLLAVPFVPNRAEGLILANRQILADQMDFLRGYARQRWAQEAADN